MHLLSVRLAVFPNVPLGQSNWHPVNSAGGRVKGAGDIETKDGFKGGYFVRVSAPTLFVSLLILFAMIALVICTIMANGWKLTKTLGATMFLFYVLFVLQDLTRTFEWI